MLTVLELLVGSGSLTPGGRPIVAVLVIVPVAPAETVPLMVMITLAPDGRVGTLPLTVLPEIVMLGGHTAPLATLPQLAETLVIAPGTISVNVVPLAADGPALLMRMV